MVLLEEVPIMRADSDRTDSDAPDGASDGKEGDSNRVSFAQDNGPQSSPGAAGLSPSAPDGRKSGKFKALSGK